MAATAYHLTNPLVCGGDSDLRPSAGFRLKPLEQSVLKITTKNLIINPMWQEKAKIAKHKTRLTVYASFSGDRRRAGSTSVFIGGFILGGIIAGTLGCVYAPQISRALTGTDKKDLVTKLPKFIYDEEKALERTRKILALKIAQLNSAIDDISSQLREADTPNDAATTYDEIEAADVRGSFGVH